MEPTRWRYTKYKDAPSTQSGVDATVQERVPYANNRNEIVGGLRIKNITYHDGISSQDRQVNYEYLVNGRSSGVLYSRPTYVQVVRNDLLAAFGIYNINTQPAANCYSNGCVACDNSASFPYLLAPNSIRPMETSQGNHLGYNEVRVSETGNGFTVYRYYGSDRWDTNTGAVSTTNVNNNVCSITIPNFPSAPISHEFKRGELKYEGHFNEAGRLLKESNYYYTYEENPSRTPAMITSSFVNSGVRIDWGLPMGGTVPGTSTDQTTMFGLTTFYEIKTAKKVYVKIEERLCSPDAACMTTTTEQFFESPYHHQLTRTLSTSPAGEAVETKIKYATDFRVSTCDAYSQCYQDYNTSSSSANAQLQIRLANVCGSNNQYCRFWEWQQHLDAKSSLRKTYLTCRDDLYTNVASCRLAAKTNADGELKPIVELQDQNTLVPVETSQWKNGNLLSATFNRFNYASSPNNQVYPSRIQNVNPPSLASTFSPANISSNTVAKDSRYQQETSLEFKDGNIVEIEKKDGIPSTYIWGYNKTLPVAKITGASHQEVQAIQLDENIKNGTQGDDALRNELEKLRTGLPDALVTTYTYSPLIGMTSETDANGRTTFYHYDKLGRLQTVKDNDGNVVKTIQYHYKNQ